MEHTLMGLTAAVSAAFASQTLDHKPVSTYITADPLTAHCTAEVMPDVAVIVGALVARTLKPTEAPSQLERQIQAVRTYVGRGHLARVPARKPFKSSTSVALADAHC
jgi:hypothetical protein